jgi:hypothetical protein
MDKLRDRKRDKNPEQSWVAQQLIKSRVICGYENRQKFIIILKFVIIMKRTLKSD